MTDNLTTKLISEINQTEVTSDEQFQELFLQLPLPLIKSVVLNIVPNFIRLDVDDIIKQRFHSLRAVIEKRSRSGKTTGLWQILLLFAYAKRHILFPEDRVQIDLETLLDGALEATQTSWTITYLYSIYEYYDRITEEDVKEPKQVFDNVPDLASIPTEKIKALLEKNGLHLKAGILWDAYVDLLLAHKKYNEAFDVIEYLMQLPIPFAAFVDRVKTQLAQLSQVKSDGTKAMQTDGTNGANDTDGDSNENTEEEVKSEEPDLHSNGVNLIDNERKTEVLKLLENYTAPALLKSRGEFDLKRKELVKSADSKAIQWLQKYFSLWTDYLDLLETSEQLQDTNFQVKSIAMGTDLLCYEYKRLLVESDNLKVPQIVIYPIFEKLAARIMSLSQLHQSFANDQKWIIEFASILKDTVKNNLEFWITLISLQSLCVGPYFNFATTQDIAPKVKNIIIEACAANSEWAKLPPLQFVTAEVNAEISQLATTDEVELKAKSREIWEAKIKNYESLVDPSDDKQIESLANLWFEYMETLGEEEDLEPYFEQALSFQPLRTIATIWMDYVSEVIDKDINRGYEQFQKALSFVKDQYKDQMWHELFEAVKQDTGLSLEELKELVSSLGKEPSVVAPKPEAVEAEKPKEVTPEVKPMVVDLTSEDEVPEKKSTVPATSASVSPKPAIPPPTAAAKKAPSPGRKQEISPPPAAFPKKRPAPTPLSPKLGKRRKLVHENSQQVPGFLQPQRPGSPPLLANVTFKPLILPQGQSLPFGAGPMLNNNFARPQMPAVPNMNLNPMQLQVAPQLQQLLPAIQLQQLAQLMQSKQREQQAIQLQQQLQQLIVQLNMNPALGPILAPQIQLISQRLLSLQQPNVGAAPPVPGGQFPFHKPPIQHDKVKRLDFDTKFQLDVKYIQDLLPHFNIDDFKRKPEEFDLSVQIEPLENVMSMFLRQRTQAQQQQPNTANLPPLPDYTVQQISELVKNPTFREIIKQLQMRQSHLEMELAQRREQILAAQAKERNTLIHMHNMRLQATPGRTDYVMKKNDNEMRSLEQTFKQQLLEFDQQSLRDFDKKIEEQQIILQQAGVPGFFPTQSQQQLAQQGQILDFIVQKIKETEKALQQQSRFENSFQQPRPQERIVTIQKNVQPVVQQTRDPRLPNMEVTIPGGGNMSVPQQQSQQLDPLMLLQNQPDILAGLMQNNPAALLIATQGTPQQKQELLNQLQSNALLIAAQGTPQQQQELMNQLIAQQQQNIGLPNLGMGIPSIGQPPQQQQNANFGMPPPSMPPMGPIGGAPMNSLNNNNANFMSPQQQLMNQLQNITNSSANPNNPLLLPGINTNNPLPQQMQPQQQQYNNNMNNNQFRGGYSKRGGGRPHNNRGRF